MSQSSFYKTNIFILHKIRNVTQRTSIESLEKAYLFSVISERTKGFTLQFLLHVFELEKYRRMSRPYFGAEINVYDDCGEERNRNPSRYKFAKLMT